MGCEAFFRPLITQILSKLRILTVGKGRCFGPGLLRSRVPLARQEILDQTEEFWGIDEKGVVA